MKKMTKRRATAILLQATQNYLRGAGQGLAHRPGTVEQQEIKEAAKRLWPDAFHFNIPPDWPH